MKHLILFCFVMTSSLLFAATPKNVKKLSTPPNPLGACLPGSSQIDLRVNNVRARLLMGGDMWWDGKIKGNYIVPNVAVGQKEVSSIFAGGIWVGAKDAIGNIKLSAASYRTNGSDFWPGPLDVNGTTNDTICKSWDRFFEVFSEEIDLHKNKFAETIKNGSKYNENDIPDNVKYWPGKNNPYFENKYKFKLPSTNQGLAPFFDRDGDDIYNPVKGDYPTLFNDFSSCPTYADQMVFSIINDLGNVHTISKGAKGIGVEIQRMAYSFITNDENNNTTFYTDKMVYRGSDVLNDAFFSVWMDPDLGCPTDDYVGCDTTRNLMFLYNSDAEDGIIGCNCNNTNTYCKEIPMLGCSYIKSPISFSFDSLTGNPNDTFRTKMSSFTLYINGGGIYGPLGSDPQTATEYFNYMSGKWRDGTRLTYGGIGYNPSSTNYTNFMFSGEPSDTNSWSMSTVNFPGQDFRTLQSCGPFYFIPGLTNSVTYAVVWTPNVQHPKPSLDKIRAATDAARILYDHCFKLQRGPDAPELTIVPLDKSFRFSFNNLIQSNNYLQGYKEYVQYIPKNTFDTNYVFEGYKVYQLLDNSVNQFMTNDSTKAKLVYQCDLKNNITNIKNWTSKYNPMTNMMEFFGKEMIEVNAANKGIPQSFTITHDAFTHEKLKNDITYYYCAVAYGYNNYEPFSTNTGVGQDNPYIESTKLKKVYSAKANYKSSIKYIESQPNITRLEGVGTGDNFLEIDRNTRDSLFFGTSNGRIKYKTLNSPVKILVLDPALCENGKFELSIFDENLNDTFIDNTAKWKLRNLNNLKDSVISDNSIFKFNEKVLNQYGFAINLTNSIEAGSNPINDRSNGFVGVKKLYNNLPIAWFNTINNGFVNTNNGVFSSNHLNFIGNIDPLSFDYLLDPYQNYTNFGNTFFPFGLSDYRNRTESGTHKHYNTPGWLSETTYGPLSRGSLSELNNVDIVLTPDKSKWSRCVVLEMADAFYTTKKNASNPLTNNYLGLETVKNPKGIIPLKFDLRGDLSVGKNDSNNDGKPDPDGEKDSNGDAIYGMGWFPGYAIDVETGKRLNIFFGENSCYRKELEVICPIEYQNGADMLWNPNDKVVIPNLYDDNPDMTYSHYAGGQHYIFIEKGEYDECKNLRTAFSSTNKSLKAVALKKFTWTTLPILFSNKQLLPLGSGNKGLIPSEVIVEMRVNNPFYCYKNTGLNNSYPTYMFEFPKNKPISNEDKGGHTNDNGRISLSPNPLSISAQQFLQIDNLLPEKHTVTIYSLDGKIVDTFETFETSVQRKISDHQKKITTGIYLVQIRNEKMESKVLKLVLTE